jgi:hypothetical protein
VLVRGEKGRSEGNGAGERKLRCNMLRKIDGLMNQEGFKKLQNNTADLYLARRRKDSEQIAILTAERKSICNDDSNFVYEEIAQ